jgi:hypothetical protein
MRTTKKTDNKSLAIKLSLRGEFLRKYHPGMFSVLDCCEGGRQLWKRLMAGRDVEYVGLNAKRERGRLAIDSARFLANSDDG